MKETTKHVLFWGGPLSNFEEVHFSLEEHEFSSSEQYFMWKKAKTFGDEEIAEKILKAKTPKEAKKLGREVRGYDEGTWNKIRTEVMEDACYAKFFSSPSLKKLLLSFPGKTFVEASPYDKIWGIGMREDDPNADNEKKWLGQNLLGQVLGRVRDRIKKEEL